MRSTAANVQLSNSAIILWLAITLAYLPHIIHQILVVNSFCIGLFVWRMFAVLYGVKAPPRIMIYSLALMITGYIIFSDPAGLGKNSGIAILCVALAVNQLYFEQAADALTIVGIGIFVGCLAFLNFDAVFITVCVICSVYLMILSLVRMYGSASNIRGGIRQANKIILLSMPVAAIIFFIVPQNIGLNFRMPAEAGVGSTGLSNSVSPGNISKLQKNTKVAFRVRFNSLPDDLGNLYWRGPVFTYYNGQSWLNSNFVENSQPLVNPPVEGNDADNKQTKYRVVLSSDIKWAIALDNPSQFDVPVRINNEGERTFANVPTSPISYQVSTDRRNLMNKPEDARQLKYLQLPNLYSYRTRQLVKRWQQENFNLPASDKKMVEKALQFFRVQPFYYSLAPARIKYDPIDEFLFNTQEGYCEHFASAFVFMMRVAGIPARVVTGYYGGEYNAIDDYLVVRQSNAHAWAEVWIDGQGWLRVDPTTVIPDHRVKVNNYASQNALLINKNWLSSLTDVVTLRIYQLRINFNKLINQSIDLIEKVISKMITDMVWTVVLLFTMLLWVGYFRYWRPARQCITEFYEHQFCNKFNKFGIQKQAGETPTSFAARIVTVRPDLRFPVEHITELYNRLRYGRQISGAEVKCLRKAVKSLKV